MGRCTIAVLLVWLAAVGMTAPGRAAVRDALPIARSTSPSTAEPTETMTAASSASLQRCKRWRALAGRLGETHAGFKLRHTVVSRLCAFDEIGVDAEVWSWPWRHQDMRADLPPQRHGQFGSWEIRCGNAGGRRRCALALETVMAAGVDPESVPLRIVSHVVIDSVAGRESVLWRLHVAQPDDGRAHAEGIAVAVGGREATEPFDACGPRGCLAEADPKFSAEVASWLWFGKPVGIALGTGSAGGGLATVLPSHGFRTGLSELIRLRRQEGRALAGR